MTTPDTAAPDDERAASTGIAGLDEILHGGLPRREMHLLQGASGTGKTTLAMQFLLAGAGAGEGGLYVTLTQTSAVLEMIARSHGWSLSGVTLREMLPSRLIDDLDAQQTVLHTEEVELGELTRDLLRQVDEACPRRVVFDSIGVIGMLAGTRARYRREILALRQALADKGCTTLFIGDQETGPERPVSSEFGALATSLIQLEQVAPEYGEARRRILVVKVRGVPFEGGYHNFRIQTGGLEVYPRLRPPSQHSAFRSIASGIETLDALLGGGLEEGTACLLIGPSGVGKSTLSAVYARAAAQRGDAAAIFLFDERPETFSARSRGVGVDLGPDIDAGRILLQQMDPVRITPGEFAQHVRTAVEARRSRVVVIDSLTGYFNVMGNTPMLLVQMHELLGFLSRRGVLTMLLVTPEGFGAVGARPPLDISYLSDSILLLRLFETGGQIRRCLAAVKKRQGEHETTIRELFIRPGGVSIGEEPLRDFQGLLGGDAATIGQPTGGGNGDG